MPKSILVADDEKDIVEILRYNLKKEGYEVITASDGKQALERARQKPDLILLDVMMPELDGWEVCRRLKRNESTSNIPIIFLTARSTDVDEVVGLELGATDFIVKPVSIPKLLARVKNALRKQPTDSLEPNARSITLGVIEILPSKHLVRVDSREVFFPRKEYEVLLYLARHAGVLVTREKLLREIWGTDIIVFDRTVDVHIRRIREKLGSHADYIETIKGVGYRMREVE